MLLVALKIIIIATRATSFTPTSNELGTQLVKWSLTFS